MENIRVYGLLIASGSDLWISTQTKVTEVMSFPGHDRDVIVPISGGLAAFDEDAVQSSKHEVEGYLKFGMPMKGSFDIIEEDGSLKVRPTAKLLFFKSHLSDPVEWDRSVEKAQIAAISLASEMLSAYTDSKMRSGLSISIEDWQGPDRSDKTTDDTVRLNVRVQNKRIMINAPEGREIDIELEDNDIRVFAYESEGGADEPVKLRLGKKGGIEVDNTDYEQDRHLISDMKP